MFVCLLMLVVFTPLGATQPPRQRHKPTPQQEAELRQAQGWLDEGIRQFSQGKLVEAAENFKKVYALFPDNPDVAFNYGMTLETLSQFQEAIPPLERAVQARPGDTTARMDLGVSYLGVHRLRKGIEELKKVVASEPQNIVAMFQIALAYHQLKDNADADTWVRRMVQRDPTSALTYVYVARVFRYAGECTKAEKNIAQAIALDPKLPEAYFERGLVEIGCSHNEAGKASLERALALSPEMPKYNLAMGEFYMGTLHEAEAGIPYFTRAIRSDPESGEAYLDLGEAYFRLHELPLAEQALRHAAELKPHQARRCHYLLGMTYEREGKIAEAKKEFAIVQKLAAQQEKATTATTHQLAHAHN